MTDLGNRGEGLTTNGEGMEADGAPATETMTAGWIVPCVVIVVIVVVAFTNYKHRLSDM